MTFGLLSMIVLGACCFHDLGLANSLGGAVLGSLITMVFPALLLYFAGRQSKEFSPGRELLAPSASWVAA